MAEWSPEPWNTRSPQDIHDATGKPIATREMWEANCRRIVACVNALKDLNPEVVAEMRSVCEAIIDEADGPWRPSEAGYRLVATYKQMARAVLAKSKPAERKVTADEK